MAATIRLWPVAAFLLLTVPGSGADAPAGAASSLVDLQRDLQSHLDQPRFAAAMWGVKVVSLDTGRTWFEHNARKLLKPASNAKLFTGALALDRLGPDFKFSTTILAIEKPDDRGVLHGDLVVYGGGDPSLAARFNRGKRDRLLEPLTEALAAAGVKIVTGDLVGDETFFWGPPYGNGWAWDDLQYYYGAAVSALTLDDNAIDFELKPGPDLGTPCVINFVAPHDFAVSNRTATVEKGQARKIEVCRPVGRNVVYVSGQLPAGDAGYAESVTVLEPGRWFLQRWRESLRDRGITLKGELRNRRWPEAPIPTVVSNLVELGAVGSPPLSEILPHMMKPSQNLYAQLLLLRVGAWAAERTPSAAGPVMETERAGLRELERFVGQAGIPPNAVQLDDGSGLSRSALVTPEAIIHLLIYMAKHRHAEVYRASLPVAGLDGTLKNRFRGTAAEGVLRAKTGTLRYVNSLSGYAQTAGGERLVFCCLLNNYEPEGAAVSSRAEIDKLVLMLVNFAGGVEK